MSLLDIWNGLTSGLFRLLVCLSVRESVHHIYIYERGRIPTVVVGVASPSFPCARHFGVMHSGTNGGATITDGRNIRGSAHHIREMRV